jgi:aspartyl-tRNA(Asn)/glutamyl-tRNA(Gln) amidotransferase subunit B
MSPTIKSLKEYETVIGLEVHVQLQTRSKMFCSCPADYQAAPPNSNVCPVCLGLPGTLPVINRKAVEYTVTTGLALNCRIPEHSKFDRKNYPYPDLMKGYQISQFDLPLAVDGSLEIEVEGRIRRIGIERVHLEEDVAKLQHVNPADGASSYSLVDVNRSGTPLMEIVSKPDLRSAEEARVYLTTLHSVVQYLGVSAANLQEGNFRCDANVSIRPAGATEYGTRTEVKNMNSFRSVYLALKYEVERQRRIVEGGGKVIQETRGWVDDRNVTVAQRSKEHAHDYRYFPEPDLPPLLIESVWVERVRRQLPELAAQRKARFMQQLGLSEYDARPLTSSRAMADYFENALSRKRLDASALESFAKNLGNWVLGDFSRWLNLTGQEIAEAKVTPAGLVELIDLIESGVLSVAMGKSVLAEAFASGDSPGKIVLEKGYSQLSDTAEVESAVANAIEDNPRAVEDYHSGKESAAGFLVGQVMKLTRGRAKPDLVQKLIRDSLESSRAP